MEIPGPPGTQTDPGHADPFRDLQPHQINGDNDMEFRIECLIEEDILEELEDFMRLTRQGLFTRALDLFNKTLKESLDKFPVIVEYIECLYDQGQTRQASQFLHQQRENAVFSKEERNSLELLDALFRVQNEPEESLATARRCTEERLSRRAQLTDIEILTSEVYLGIIHHVYVITDGTGLRVEDYLAPLASDEPGLWGAWKTLCMRLWREEKIWESQRIFSHLVNLLAEEEIRQLFHNLTQSTAGGGGGSYEESHALAHLSVINSLMEPLQNFRKPFILVKTACAREREQIVRETRSTALKVCHAASVDLDCRQLLEARALEALWSVVDSNGTEACDVAVKNLTAVLKKSERNNDQILKLKCAKYILEVKDLRLQRAKGQSAEERILRRREEDLLDREDFLQWQEEDLRRLMRRQREQEEDILEERKEMQREREAFLREREVFLREREAFLRERQAVLREDLLREREMFQREQRYFQQQRETQLVREKGQSQGGFFAGVKRRLRLN